ncbi:Maf family protein [Elioraea rosea]|uniref:Maf family protein n=1 Tax=Elioraea rosea TaxID=2492390 RepID=UPI001EF5E490|nr:Maf family protein [Elioraea rosea]
MTGLLQNPDIPLVLASTSATRAGLLRSAGVAFETAAPGVDETSIKEAAKVDGLSPEDAALLLAELKARRISDRLPSAVVIGADQILVCEGQWFDKPESRAAAAAQLAALAGRTHRLVTAVLCMRGGVVLWRHVASPRLGMRPLAEATIAAYLEAAGEAVLGSVGAYQAEGLGVRLFSSIEGEHAAILGLPLLPLLGFLRQHGALRD